MSQILLLSEKQNLMMYGVKSLQMHFYHGYSNICWIFVSVQNMCKTMK